MMMRKKYSKEFKPDAITLVCDQGYRRAEAARSFDINATSAEAAGPENIKRIMARHFMAVAH